MLLWVRAGTVVTCLYAGERWAAVMWGDNLPWAIITAACFAALVAIEVYRAIRKTKDDDPATRGIIREELAANNLEIKSIRDAAAQLSMEPLGSDGATLGHLPDGTNLVKLSDGSFRLALPIHLSANETIKVADSVSLKIIRDDD